MTINSVSLKCFTVAGWSGAFTLKNTRKQQKTTLTKEDVKQVKKAVGYQRRLKATAR